MTVGVVEFYRMDGSLSSGEYPLLTRGQNLTPYRLAQFLAVKYRAGLQVTLDVPIFDNYFLANLCTVGGRWFWVTEYREKTTAEGQITFTLDYAAPTDLLRSMDTITCDTKRLPVLASANLHEEITNGQMVVEDIYPFDMDCPGFNATSYGGPAYWIQISGHTNNGEAQVYGGFITYSTQEENFSENMSIRADAVESEKYIPYSDWREHMASITGFTDDDIDDVSVSKRCPYRTASQVIDQSTGETAVWLVGATGNKITQLRSTWGQYYRLDRLIGVNVLQHNQKHISIRRTENLSLYGSVGLYDWNRNEIMSLDGDRSEAYVTLDAAMHADMSGIYCVVKYNNQVISIPEGKLPYFGNTYDNYRAYSMEGDRMAMQFAIESADNNRETEMWSALGNTVASVGNNAMIGAMGGNPVSVASGVVGGIASGIVSGYQSQRAYELAVNQAQFNAEISRKRATDQPSSGYNVPYGSIYAYLNEKFPLCVMTKMPNCVPSVITSWQDRRGYPSEGVKGVQIHTGYFQGTVLADSRITERGMFFDRLNEVFQRGFKFVSP